MVHIMMLSNNNNVNKNKNELRKSTSARKITSLGLGYEALNICHICVWLEVNHSAATDKYVAYVIVFPTLPTGFYPLSHIKAGG